MELFFCIFYLADCKIIVTFVQLDKCIRHTEMRKNTHVKHEGTIDRIEGTNVFVRITQHSACAGCHVHSACTVADRSEKIIETICSLPGLHAGQRVWVVGNEAMGGEALRLAFVYPFIVLCCALLIAYSLTGNEVWSGLIALCSLAPYYLILYLLRHKLRRDLVFTVEPME